MTTIASLTVAVIGAVLFRAIVTWCHRAVLRQGFQGDASIHFAILRQLRKDPQARNIDQYLIRYEPMSYPLAFHRACRVLPLEMIQRYPFLPSMILFVLATAGFVLYFQHLERLAFEENTWSALWAALFVFFIMPTHWSFVGPGIAYFTLSARYFARIMTGAFFMFAIVGTAYGDPLSLILAVVAAAIALLAAMFATQALLFVTPLVALFSLDPVPLLLLLASVAVAYAMSPWRFPLGIRHMLTQWRLYRAVHKKSTVAQAALVNFPNWLALWRNRTGVGDGLLRIIRTEPFRTLLRQPEVVFAALLAVAAFGTPETAVGLAGSTILAVIAATVLIYLAVTTPRFDHLGESYRYLEYVLFFISPMAVGLLLRRVDPDVAVGGFLWFGTLAALTPLVAYLFLSRWRWPDRDELQDLLDRLNLPVGAVVLPVGLQIAGNVCARRADLQSFWYQPGLISAEIYRDYIEVWPFLKFDPTAIMVRHGVTHAIVDKHLLPCLPKPYHLPGMRRIAESERYIAYEQVTPADDPQGVGEILMPEPGG